MEIFVIFVGSWFDALLFIGWATTFNRLFAFDNACPKEVSSEEE